MMSLGLIEPRSRRRRFDGGRLLRHCRTLSNRPCPADPTTLPASLADWRLRETAAGDGATASRCLRSHPEGRYRNNNGNSFGVGVGI